MAMTEVAQATVTIIPNMKGSQQKIQDDLGISIGDAGEKAGKSFGSRLIGAVGKLGVAAAVTKIVKDSLDQGAELQQNLGGTEAVFGDFAKSVQDTADKAYKNMGLSASDYMATANKMGSLFQGSGLEQQRSLELTEQAMQRAADVASVMGLDTSAAMESIAGAAKGNFTMMDNLGVAMNATTLQAYALEKGINFDWKTADNAEKAELAMEMFFDKTSQYAGNYAREADETFSGSLESMKAAATNVLGKMSIGEPIYKELDALQKSVKSFIVGNLLPMIGNAIGQLPNILGHLPGFVADLLPDLLASGVDIVDTLLHSIIDNFPAFLAGIGKLAMAIPEAIMNIDWGGIGAGLLGALDGMMYNIWDSVTSMLSATFGIEMPDWDTVVQDITDLWENVKAGIGDFFKAAFDIIMDDDKTITEKISALWDLVKAGIGNFFKAYFDLVIPAYETIVGAISDWWGTNVWPAIQDFFKATFGIDIPDWNTIVEPIQQLWEDVKAGIANLFSVMFGVDTPSAEDVISAIDGLWASVWDGIGGFFKAVFGLEIPTWEEVKESISNFWTDIKTGISGWFKATFNIKLPSPSDIIDKVKGVWEDVKEGVSGFFKKPFGVNPPDPDTVTKKLEEAWKKIKDGIGNFFSWVFSIKPPSLDKVIQDIKDFWGDVVKGIGDFLTLKWIFGEPDEEEVKQQFTGGGRSFDIGEDNVNIDSEAIQKALDDANLKLSDIDTSSLDKAKQAVTDAVSAMETSFSNMKLELNAIGTAALGRVKTLVSAAVRNMKETMNFSWSLPALHGHLPIISVSMRSASSSDGRTHVSYPELSVSGFRWFAQGGIFNEPTVIGIGDSKGPEAAVPLDQMWRRMSAEFDKHMNGGATVNNYFTVDGAQDPEAWAVGAARMIKRELRMG